VSLVLWTGQPYALETHNPDQSQHTPDAVGFDPSLFAWYQKFTGLRQRWATIRLGSYTTAVTDHARQLYAFRRTLDKEDVLLVLNRGSQPAIFSHAVLASRKYRDAFTQAATTKVTVPARDVVVLRAR
jgi:cyclomaltodextrinase